MRTKNLIHPGEILKEEFLEPMGISQNRLALDIRVPAPRINAIVNGKRSISADTALRLGQYFKMEPQFWLNLQSNYDLGVAAGGAWAKIKNLIPEFVPLRSAAAL
ncbi:MAG: HigA family addiction module antitoxin [Kiritimatiellae bacterium]|nr:HigA family addiction module antitoxin [Kiritimatiellia bacterium]